MEEPRVAPAPSSRWRRLRPWLLAAVAIDLILVTALVGWLGSKTEREIDLRTGRVRTVRCVAWVTVGERVEATALSRELTGADLRDAEPLWRPLPGAEAEIAALALTWRCARFHPEARRLMAKDVLALWETGGSVEASRPFTRRIEDLIEAAGAREIAARDILEVWRALEAERRAAE
ncbi:MAG TPA: hypothetical protein PK280_14220 [Planctomycetota bacterium]|nr:hypothetical protein [Planctomycetota bacterium]